MSSSNSDSDDSSSSDSSEEAFSFTTRRFGKGAKKRLASSVSNTIRQPRGEQCPKFYEEEEEKKKRCKLNNNEECVKEKSLDCDSEQAIVLSSDSSTLNGTVDEKAPAMHTTTPKLKSVVATTQFQPEVVLSDSDDDSFRENEPILIKNDSVSLMLQKSKEAREALMRENEKASTAVDDERSDSDVEVEVVGENNPISMLKSPPLVSLEQDRTLVDGFVTPSIPQNNIQSSIMERVSVTTRIKGGDPAKTHLYQLKKWDPFSKLLKAYKEEHGYSSFKMVYLEFNGQRLDPESTPAMYHHLEIKNNCLVEIVDEAERQKQIARMPNFSSTKAATLSRQGQISLKIRINGNEGSIHTINLNRRDKFQILMENFYSSANVGKADCNFLFDGDLLNPNETPEGEDLEGGEIIDAKVKKTALEKAKLVGSGLSKVQVPHVSPLSFSPQLKMVKTSVDTSKQQRISVITRIKGGNPAKTHLYQIKKEDPFKKIINAYRGKHGYSSFKAVCLEFNGQRLDEGETPNDHSMLDNCLVEIVDEVERQKQVAHMPCSSLSTSSVVPGEISLKLRINGNENSIESIRVHSKESFQILIDKFHHKNSAYVGNSKFLLDGGILDPNGTPEGEDLEGGEMIDVKVNLVTQEKSKGSIVACDAQAQTLVPQPNLPRKEIIHVQTIRNNTNSAKPKKFRIYSTDKLSKLKEGYMKYYKKRGCRRVRFYFKNTLIEDINKAFVELGVGNMDSLVAMENGRKYVET